LYFLNFLGTAISEYTVIKLKKPNTIYHPMFLITILPKYAIPIKNGGNNTYPISDTPASGSLPFYIWTIFPSSPEEHTETTITANESTKTRI